MKGFVQSIQSLGAGDGPGVRCAVFMQGCPLRCLYCHNPETWQFGTTTGAEEYTPKELAQKVLRLRPYWGENGGVTLSGGEPLAQPGFAAEFFALMQSAGVHTALDTAGTKNLAAARAVLQHTNLVLADIKAPSEALFTKLCGQNGSLADTKAFLALTCEMKIPLWVRHVALPLYTANVATMQEIKSLAETYENLEKIEWLPYHNTCEAKYENLHLTYPLAGVPALTQSGLAALVAQLE